MAASNVTNPYVPLLRQAQADLVRVPGEGFQARLIVLWILGGIALVLALAYAALLIIDARLKRRKLGVTDVLWIFRRVPQPQGDYIVTNVKAAHTFISIVTLPFSLATVWTMGHIYLRGGSTSLLAPMQAFPAALYTLHAWVISCGQLQALLIVLEPSPSRRWNTPRIANTVFLIAGAVVFALMLGCATAETILSHQLEGRYHEILAILENLVATYSGSIDVAALMHLQTLGTQILAVNERNEQASFAMCGAGGVVFLAIFLVNCSSFWLVHIVRKQIKAKSTSIKSSGTATSALPSVVSPVVSTTFVDFDEGANETRRQIIKLRKAERDLLVIALVILSLCLVTCTMLVWTTVNLVRGQITIMRWSWLETNFLLFNWSYHFVLLLSFVLFFVNAYRQRYQTRRADAASSQPSIASSAARGVVCSVETEKKIELRSPSLDDEPILTRDARPTARTYVVNW